MSPEQLLAWHDCGLPWPDALAASAPTDLAPAYQTALEVRALRIARGERPAGYKIGFTNRGIWSRYQVFAPIWGTVYDRTLLHAPDGAGTVNLDACCQPRLEPEIVFGLRATPPADPSLDTLLACIAWLAPGFEVVQSHRPDWVFTAAQTVADGALHARLLVGRPLPTSGLAASGAALDQRLAAAHVRLLRDGQLIDQGQGQQVLDGPLHALQHFVHELQRCPGATALQPGDVVTTGTWTDAWPVAPGQQWQAVFDPPIGTLDVAFT